LNPAGKSSVFKSEYDLRVISEIDQKCMTRAVTF
jgi:hypothetical protein